jgi:hypothetical protein
MRDPVQVVFHAEDEGGGRVAQGVVEVDVGDSVGVKGNVLSSGFEHGHDGDDIDDRPPGENAHPLARSDAVTTNSVCEAVRSSVEIAVGDGLILAGVFDGPGIRSRAGVVLKGVVDEAEWHRRRGSHAVFQEESSVGRGS